MVTALFARHGLKSGVAAFAKAALLAPVIGGLIATVLLSLHIAVQGALAGEGFGSVLEVMLKAMTIHLIGFAMLGLPVGWSATAIAGFCLNRVLSYLGQIRGIFYLIAGWAGGALVWSAVASDVLPSWFYVICGACTATSFWWLMRDSSRLDYGSNTYTAQE